jgi:adenylate cyclase
MIKLLTKTWAVYLTLAILIGIYILNPVLLQSTRLNTFDFYQTFGKNYESKSIILLDISDKALEKQGQWPWKRDLLGRTIVNAYRNGAALVILQVVFPHKDRLGGDEIFVKMISKYPVILTETNDVKNLISISRKALAIGNVSVPVDIDGTIRKLPLDKSIPEVILKVLNAETLAKDTIWIDFRHNIPRIDYTDKDWSSLKGKIVFIGTTFQGSTFVTTPDGLKNTHEIMAISTETLLSGNYISRPNWLPYAEFAFIILGALFFLIVIPRCGVMWSAIWYVGYLFDLTLASSYLWTQHLFLVDWFSPLVIGSVIWGQLTYNNYSKENKLRLQIKKQFEHYLSPDMVKKLQKNPSLLKLGGERKELTFMFSDIRGFTPISESMKDNPEELTRYVNKFLTAMTDIILKNGGTIDKYMGDCIMAFWNAPIDCKNHRELAVKSAIEMKAKLDQMNKNAEFNPPLKIGIGLNTGDCLVGNMGSEQRFDYSVIGDAVNLASRLEGVSKYYDTTIIVSENTADGIDYIPLSRPKGIKFYKVDNTFVKGKKEKISIFSVH